MTKNHSRITYNTLQIFETFHEMTAISVYIHYKNTIQKYSYFMMIYWALIFMIVRTIVFSDRVHNRTNDIFNRSRVRTPGLARDLFCGSRVRFPGLAA